MVALQLYRDALEVETRLRNTIGTARALCNLSEVAEAKSDFPRAWRCSAAAEHLFAQAGSPLQGYATAMRDRVAAADESLTETLPVHLKAETLRVVVEWAMG